MVTTTTVKGQIVIPAAVRRSMGITKGTPIEIIMDAEQGRIILVPITREFVGRLRGKFKGKNLLGELKRERARDLKDEERPSRKAKR